MESTTTSDAENRNQDGYYCHKCETTITAPLSNTSSCPLCQDGFIEKLPNISPTAPTAASFPDRNNDHQGDSMDSIPTNLNRFINDPTILNRFLDTLTSMSDLDTSQDVYQFYRPSGSSTRPGSRRDTTSESTQSDDRRRTRSQPTYNFVAPFEQIGLFSEMWNSAGPNTVNIDNNGPIFFVSNPGDYAWGREGLDTIVTQLLNQMDSSGPPPLAKDKIKELPFVTISEKHISENVQCSVCWDAFKLAENVRQLPCEHIYHDICVVPWLELHGTCPICRKLLCEDGNDGRMGFSQSGGLEALLRVANRSNSSNLNMTNNSSVPSSSGASSSTSGSSSSSSSTSSNGSFKSPSLDLD